MDLKIFEVDTDLIKDNRGFGGRKLKFQKSKQRRSICGCCINNTRKYQLDIKYRRRLIRENLTATVESYPPCA